MAPDDSKHQPEPLPDPHALWLEIHELLRQTYRYAHRLGRQRKKSSPDDPAVIELRRRERRINLKIRRLSEVARLYDPIERTKWLAEILHQTRTSPPVDKSDEFLDGWDAAFVGIAEQWFGLDAEEAQRFARAQPSKVNPPRTKPNPRYRR